jgi:hypothetical protein
MTVPKLYFSKTVRGCICTPTHAHVPMCGHTHMHVHMQNQTQEKVLKQVSETDK